MPEATESERDSPPWLVRTERLVLRAPTTRDLAACVAVHCDPEAHRHTPRGPRTEKQAGELLDMLLRDWSEHGIGYWVIEHEDELIGFGGIRHACEDGEPVLNVYYRFLPKAWGKGFAQEMAGAALDYARRALPMVPPSIVTDPDNAAALRLAHRLGFAEHRKRIRDGHLEVILRPAGTRRPSPRHTGAR
ncbi:GNAT family N-acetyltransferase [Sciscionella marina]|uniref:GNAT family N-acetyltransferase n=1 Tax=Sciscionella marina TaxID=508770 RepID=UPI001969EECB|nr:GNAT family N-acetyltransferase [Sciscionella marina]